jgi:hypothetical protein
MNLKKLIDDFNFQTQYGGRKRLDLSHVESIKNRENRSALLFHSMFPEIFLSAEVAHPDEVKILGLDVGFDNMSGSKCGLCNSMKDCENCCYWDSKYNETLCSSLTKFHNLEILIAVDLDLTTELWIEFAKNCKCLKEIYFYSVWIETDCFFFQGGKEKALDSLFQIPTLEKVFIGYRICLPYIPPGPSNIKHLELNRIEVDNDNRNGEEEISNEIYSKNLHTHQNIKTLVLIQGRYNPFKLEDIQLSKMENLEELIFEFEDDIEPSKILPPNLKKICFGYYTDKEKLIKKFKSVFLKCPKIEEIEIKMYRNKQDVSTRLAKEINEELKEEMMLMPNLKKIKLIDDYKKYECVIWNK